MHPADHQSMLVENAPAFFIERAHDLRSFILSQRLLAGRYIIGRPIFDDFALRWRKLYNSLPKIGPLHIGMMEKIGVTAVIRASLAGEIQLSGDKVVGRFHPAIKISNSGRHGR